MSNILDSYIKTGPSPQSAVDIFKDEWSSMLPPDCGAISGGKALHFDDARLTWFIERIGGLAGKEVLELGPMEGGHTWMCEQAGAHSVTAVEANTRAYLKCLIVAEIMTLARTRFLLGDFVEYLKTAERTWEIGLASGVLYHMRQPVELIDLLSRRCQEVLVWTHYHDPERARTDETLRRTLGETETQEHGNFRCNTIRKFYGAALGWQGFCGGSAEFARWMTREDLLLAFAHFGFDVSELAFDQPDHPNGPALAFRASNRRLSSRSLAA
jgi:hypothetical protein